MPTLMIYYKFYIHTGTSTTSFVWLFYVRELVVLPPRAQPLTVPA